MSLQQDDFDKKLRDQEARMRDSPSAADRLLRLEVLYDCLKNHLAINEGKAKV